MPTPFARMTGLFKTYNLGGATIQALNGVDMDIEAGSFSVIMGPSGSGKSTLLHLLGGLDRPTNGRIEVGAQMLDKLDENALAIYRRKTVGFIFQSFNLLPTMTAVDNVALPMRFARVSRRERHEQALKLLDKVGLADRAYHKPTQLSGGQQQRVAVARSLANDPQLILADEPTGNLDLSSGASIMRLLSELHKSGRTVVVVTHDARMTRYATQTVHIIDGQVVTEAEYEAVLASLDEEMGEEEEEQ
ncbi:MAG: ABC transporter ATP-binding protein [Anaerolineae bacterium]|nr:ABC transporter ATP-binding protein [Anaerolineae bacterium]